MEKEENNAKGKERRILKDDTVVYFISNTIVYITLFVLCIVLILNMFHNIIVRIILITVSFFFCGYIEEKVLSKYINGLVELLMNHMRNS